MDVTDAMIFAASAALQRAMPPEAWPTNREVQAALSAAFAAIEPIPDADLERWAAGVPIFAGVAPDQLRWIARKVERRHGIGEPIPGEVF